MIRWVIRKLKALIVCVIFGTAYGAVCGAAYGGILTHAAFGITMGGFFGAAMGGVAGAVGCVVGGPLGWCLAGVLGGIAPGLVFGSSPDLFFLLPALIGGALGLAVGFGLRKGKSLLPGVRQLAAVLNDARPPARTVRHSSATAEVTPSLAPVGRGDEAAPAGSGS